MYYFFLYVFLHNLFLVFQVQIFGSFKTGLYLPTRLVIFQCKFHTKEKSLVGPVTLGLFICSPRICVTCVNTCYAKKVLSY